MKTCPKCNFFHNNEGKFCSRSCANSRGPRSYEFKEKVRNKLKGQKHSDERIEKILFSKQANKSINISKSNCVICGEIISRHKKTCSKLCFQQLAQKNALTQIKHGGGKKGKYKGIPCDSTYELAFLIWNLDNKTNIKRCNKIYYYEYKNKILPYLPDFIVDGITYEIKGYMSARAQAKLNQNSDIILLTKIEIAQFIRYVQEKYKVKSIEELYDDVKYNIHLCINCNQTFNNFKSISTFCSRRCSGEFRRKENIKNKKCGWLKVDNHLKRV